LVWKSYWWIRTAIWISTLLPTIDPQWLSGRARLAWATSEPGVDSQSSRQAVRLADEYPEVYAAVGVHPNEASGWDKTAFEQLKELAGHPRWWRSEIGLDFYRERTARSTAAPRIPAAARAGW
jgi:hypothetical protein